ncbi:MAG: very short patch repair endonuclease [Candidatus Methanomethyliaceae archaeon]
MNAAGTASKGARSMSSSKDSRLLTKSEQMARVRSYNTKPECILRSALWKAGLRYRLHSALPGTPDIVFPRKKVAVFVDGCFWHGCPQHYSAPKQNGEFWGQKLQRNMARDRLVDQSLSELGWTVVRVWEHEISRSLGDVIDRIREVLGRY